MLISTYVNYRCLRLPQNCGYPLGLSQEKNILITTLLIARNCLRRITFQFMGPLVSYRSFFIKTMLCFFVICSTGKSLSEALIFASTNPQYDDILFIELQVRDAASSEKMGGHLVIWRA